MHRSIAHEPAVTLSLALSEPPALPRRRLPRVPAWVVLALITLAGGAIRFTHLDRPCLWGDEALVYWRTCGTYEDMLTPLRSDGFGPLHYELIWAMSQFVKPTPIVLRLVPAICGTLLIPAIYFLARQLLPKSTSLLAAATAASSGFLIFYSRDAKMYMQTWCFATLSAACLLWWLRSSRSTAWLGWVAAGCIACGTHATAMAVVALSPLFLLTQRKVHWRQGLLLVAGLIVIFSGPVGYYTKFNEYVENIEEGGWRRSGIFWVDNVNAGMTGPELVRNSGTAPLMGWTWPNPRIESAVPPGMVTWPKIAAVAISVILLLAMLPWPKRWRPRDHSVLSPLPVHRTRVRVGAVCDFKSEIPNGPPPQPSPGVPEEGARDGAAEPGWRALLWLSVWILVPGYVFYCHSVENFESPTRWLSMFVDELLDGRWWIVRGAIALSVTALAIAAVFRPTRRALPTITAKAAVISVVFGLLVVVYTVCRPLALDAMLANRKWHSIWMPRYLGFLWPAVGIAIAVLLMRLPTWPVRAVAILIVLGVNAAFGVARFAAGTEPPVDQMAADVFDAQETGSFRTYIDIPRGDPNPGGGSILSMPGRYYLQMNAWRQPMSPGRFMMSMNEYSYRGGYNPATMADEVRHAPDLQRFVKWDDFSTDGRTEITPPGDDGLTAMLPGWRLVSDRWYPVHTFWDWQRRGNFRRREFEKVK